MSGSAIVAWAGRRSAVEWVSLAAALAVFIYAGWDGALWDARWQLGLHLIGLAAIGGVAAAALRGTPMPRTPIDIPILGLLLAFAIATVLGLNLGMSLRAMGVIVAYAALLPVALLAVRWRPSWLGVVTSIPVLVISIPTLAVLVARRVEWIVAGAPGLPPLRLPAEGTPFGSVAVPPFVIWPAWALAGLVADERWRRAIQWGLVAVGVPLTILSGSRSAWLAMGVTAIVAIAPWAWARRGTLLRPRQPSPRMVLAAAVALVVLAAGSALVIPRLTAVTSLIYRAALWRDTLAAWTSDPVFGIGPGFMPYARQMAAPDFTFPVRQPHSHNLLLGVLGDAGLVGLVAALVLLGSVAWYAGPWRCRSGVGRRAAFALLGLGVGGLFEDLTFLPNFDLLAICLLAVALTDAGAVTSVRLPAGSRRLLAGVAAGTTATVLVGAMVMADAGAIAYRIGVDAAANGDWPAATAGFQRVVQIDPWHPAGPKALTVAADRAGDTALARGAAEDAVALNPGDAASWTNLAWLCAAAHDDACALDAAAHAVTRSPFLGPDLLNAAVIDEALGRPERADDAYRRSLLSQRLTAFVLPWPRPVEVDAPTTEEAGEVPELNALVASWSQRTLLDPDGIHDPAVRALAHAMRGERAEAETWLARAVADRPDSITTWDIATVIHHHWGVDIEHDLDVGEVVRGSRLPPPGPIGGDQVLTYDIGSFRAYPADGYVRAVQRLQTDPGYPWILERTLP